MSPGNRDTKDKLPPVDMTGLPPGPRWPVLLQTAGLLRFRHRFHPYLRRKYGDVFTVRLAPGGRPTVNGRARREYDALVTEVARAEVGTWHPGEEFRSPGRMNRLTLEVILRVV